MIINAGIDDNLYGIFFKLLEYPVFWLYIFVAPIACIIPPYIIKYISRAFWPTVDTVIRERELIQRRAALKRARKRAKRAGVKLSKEDTDELDYADDNLETQFLNDVHIKVYSADTEEEEEDTVSKPPKEPKPEEQESASSSSSSSQEPSAVSEKEPAKETSKSQEEIPAVESKPEDDSSRSNEMVAIKQELPVDTHPKSPAPAPEPAAPAAPAKKKKKAKRRLQDTGFDFTYTVPLDVRTSRANNDAPQA